MAQKHQPTQRNAQKRIEELFTYAKEKPAYAQRYITLARKIALRNKAGIPKNLRKQFCSACNTLFAVGKNCMVRIRKSTISITCLVCKKVTRITRQRRKQS